MNPVFKVGRYMKLLMKYNTVEGELEVLKDYVKDDCFNKIISKIGEPLELKRLRDENKRLRIKVKELKSCLKG